MALSVNWLDVLIIVILNVGMFVGFWQGTLRQLLALGAVYASVVISSRMYPLVSPYVIQLSPRMVSTVADVIAFVILLFLTGLVLTFILFDVTRTVLTPRVVGLSRVSGAAIGLIIAGLLVTVSLVALSFMTLTPWPSSSEPIRQVLISARSSSNLVVAFRRFAPYLLQSIGVWGGTLPPIFSADILAS